MSKKCRAFSASKLGKPDSKATLREAFYAGWEAALAEQPAEQVPVVWAKDTGKKIRITHMPMNGEDGWRPLGYIDTAPQPRKRLTREEIMDAVCDVDLDWHKGWPLLDEDAPNRYETLCRAIEAAVWGEKT